MEADGRGELEEPATLKQKKAAFCNAKAAFFVLPSSVCFACGNSIFSFFGVRFASLKRTKNTNIFVMFFN